MATKKEITDVLSFIDGLPKQRLQDAVHDLVFELKAKEAAMLVGRGTWAIEYIIDEMGPTLAKKTIRGIASRR